MKKKQKHIRNTPPEWKADGAYLDASASWTSKSSSTTCFPTSNTRVAWDGLDELDRNFLGSHPYQQVNVSQMVIGECIMCNYLHIYRLQKSAWGKGNDALNVLCCVNGAVGVELIHRSHEWIVFPRVHFFLSDQLGHLLPTSLIYLTPCSWPHHCNSNIYFHANI